MKTSQVIASFWLAFLLSAAIFFPQASSSAEPYGLNLRISIGLHYEHRGMEWRAAWMTVTSDTVIIQAQAFSIDIYSKTRLNADSVGHVRLIGDARPFTLEKGQISTLYLKVPSQGIKNRYILELDAGLSDASGKALGRERRIEIRVRPPTEAKFDLLGKDAVYEDIGIPGEAEPDVSARHLSTAPKDIRITFSRAVDRASVKSSINQDLKDKPEARSFRWTDDRTLILHIDKQERTSPVDWPLYLISLKQARDVDGFPIFGQMSFTVDHPCHLSRLDLLSGRSEPIVNFNDSIYMSYPFPTVSRFIILDDGWRKSVFDLEKGRMVSPDSSRQSIGHIMSWLDERRFLWSLDGLLHLYDLMNGQDSIIYDGLPRGHDVAVEAVSLSPDRRNVAIMIQPHLLVVSMDGRLLYQSRERISLFHHDNLAPTTNLCWMGNHAVLYDALARPTDETTNTCNIFKVDLSTNRSEALIENARRPVLSPLGTRLLFQRPTSEFLKMTYLVAQAGHESELTACHGYDCENFLFVDEDRLVFERRKEFTDEIVLLDLKRGQETVLTTGAIIGISPNRRYLYTNSFKGQLHYMD